MMRICAGLLVASAMMLASAGSASAQVVIQGQGQAGGVYGQGSVYVQPGQAQPQPQPQQLGGSPYVQQGPATQPQPVRTVVHTSPTTSLLVPGVLALGAGWLIHGFGALSIGQDCFGDSCPGAFGNGSLDEWVGYSWIPIAGPWIAYGATDWLGDYAWFNIVFGIIQGVGAVLTVLGVAIQQEWEEAIYVDLGNDVGLAFDGGGNQVGATLFF